MKKQVTIIIAAVVLLAVFQQASFAQKSSESEKKKAEQEKLMQEAISNKEKALKEKERVEELYKNQFIDAATRRAEMQEIDEAVRFFDRGTGYAVAYPDGYVGVMSRSGNSETLEYRRTVKEATFTKEIPFDVDEEAKSISISVSGSCKEGEIRIKILMPGGKTYTEVLLDEYGSVNWKKSFATEDDDKSRVGKWRFIITSKESTGNLTLSLRSY